MTSLRIVRSPSPDTLSPWRRDAIRIVDGPGSGTRVPLTKDEFRIGRDPGCDIVVPWMAVSRQHARVVRRGHRFVLQDVASRNGTYLNDRPVRGLCPLRDGDRIRIIDLVAAFESPAGPMTEAEWLGSPSSQAMLTWLRANGGVADRSLRLFAAACCRRFNLPGYEGEVARLADLAERHAEAGGRQEDLAPSNLQDLPWAAAWRAVWAADAWQAAADSARHAVEAAPFSPLLRPWPPYTCLPPCPLPIDDLWPPYEAAEGVMCRLLRDVVGPRPFRPLAVAPSVLHWNYGTVPRLAQAAYEDRLMPGGTLDPFLLAVLADALEEAGCEDQDLLLHLRGPGPHVRGCHFLDLVRGAV